MRPSPLLAPLALVLLAGCAGGSTAPASAPDAAPTATPTPVPPPEPTPPPPPPLEVAADVEARVAQFVRTPLSADIAALPAGETRTLAELIAASRWLDEVFLRQVWAGNPELA